MKSSEYASLEGVTPGGGAGGPLSSMLSALVTPGTLEDQIAAVLRAIDDPIAGKHCSVMIIENDRFQTVAAPSLPPAFGAAVRGLPVDPSAGPCGATACSTDVVVVPDLRVQPPRPELRPLLESCGIRACWSAPIRDRHGRILGAFVQYYTEPRSPDVHDHHLLEAAARTVGMIVQLWRSDNVARHAEQRLRRLLESTLEAVWVADPQWRTVLVNDRFCQLAGRTREELCGPLHQVGCQGVPDLRAQLVERLGQRAVARTRADEVQFTRPDGTVLWAQVIATPVDDANDAPGGTLFVVADVTERRRAEQLLRLTGRMARIGGWRLAVDSSAVAWTDETYAIHELPPGTPIGLETAVSFYTPADRVRISQAVQHCVATGESWCGEYQIVTAKGRTVWVESVGQAERDGSGRITHLSGTFRDITDRRSAELALRESEEHYRTIVESTSDGIWMVDADFKTVFVNSKAAAMVGATTETMIGRPVMDFVSPTEQARAAESMERRRQGLNESMEWTFRHPGGRDVRVLITSNPLATADGRFRGAVAMLADVTAQREAEERLRQYTLALERSNRELEQFAYVASHDLQEPLRMVTSFAQLLSRRFAGRLDVDADEFIGYIVEGATRMQRLIDDLLAFSRVNTRAQKPRRVDLNTSLDHALANLHAAVSQSDAEIIRGHMPVVIADPAQLPQILQNLIGNAIKFRGEAAPRIRIWAEPCTDPTGGWTIKVADNGIGIEPRHRDRVFRMFQRLHPREKYPGTGVGLAICQRIVEHHNGRIWIEDVPAVDHAAPSSGCVFCFTLPDLPEHAGLSGEPTQVAQTVVVHHAPGIQEFAS